MKSTDLEPQDKKVEVPKSCIKTANRNLTLTEPWQSIILGVLSQTQLDASSNESICKCENKISTEN